MCPCHYFWLFASLFIVLFGFCFWAANMMMTWPCTVWIRYWIWSRGMSPLVPEATRSVWISSVGLPIQTLCVYSWRKAASVQIVEHPKSTYTKSSLHNICLVCLTLLLPLYICATHKCNLIMSKMHIIISFMQHQPYQHKCYSLIII